LGTVDNPVRISCFLGVASDANPVQGLRATPGRVRLGLGRSRALGVCGVRPKALPRGGRWRPMGVANVHRVRIQATAGRRPPLDQPARAQEGLSVPAPALFLATLVPNDHLVSWDVTNAFYHIRLRPSDRKYFRFVARGVVYEPRVLPFGMRLMLSSARELHWSYTYTRAFCASSLCTCWHSIVYDLYLFVLDLCIFW